MCLQLENCAFCGGEPRLTRCGDQKELFVYQCSVCYETPVMFHEASVCDFSAKCRWNDRTRAARFVISVYNSVKARNL